MIGRELGQHVEAVLILFDHALHTAHLALHAAQAGHDLGLVMGVRCGGPRRRLNSLSSACPVPLDESNGSSHVGVNCCHVSIIPRSGILVNIGAASSGVDQTKCRLLSS